MNTEKKPAKFVSIMCFHDEMCQVFNALMTAQSLLRSGAKVTIFFGSRGIYAVHKDKIDKLVCLPDQPQEIQDAVTSRMEELELPEISLMMETLYYEGATLLACPLNLSVFGMSESDLVMGVTVADPATYYKDVMIGADMNLAF